MARLEFVDDMKELAGFLISPGDARSLWVGEQSDAHPGAVATASWTVDEFLCAQEYPFDRILLNVHGANDLASCLVRLGNSPLEVIAVRGGDHFASQPLVLLSLPKAGSHFLISLAEAFGYEAGGILPFDPAGGRWYSLDHESIHTSCRAYFLDKNTHGEFYGGRLTRFDSCRAIACFRHPRDIVRSRLDYNFDRANTVMGCYMSGRSRADKVNALLDPRALFGDFGAELSDFANWVDFPNVIPVGYEELRGSDLVPGWLSAWQLQLHLQVAGDPRVYWERAFGKSDTFRGGDVFSPDTDVDPLLGEIGRIAADYMKRLGYSVADPWPGRLAELRAGPRLPVVPVFPGVPVRITDTPNFHVQYLQGEFRAVGRNQLPGKVLMRSRDGGEILDMARFAESMMRYRGLGLGLKLTWYGLQVRLWKRVERYLTPGLKRLVRSVFGSNP